MRLFEFARSEWLDATRNDGKRRIDKWLAHATYIFLLLFVIAAPYSIAVTQIAYGAATFLWLMRWWSGGLKPLRQRLALPLIIFLLLSAISSVCSFSPAASCYEMKKVGLLLIAALWFQNIDSPRQLKWFSSLLILSCGVNVAYTAWQYTYGMGAQLNSVNSTPSLERAGYQEGDVISRLGGHLIGDRSELMQALSLSPASRLRSTVLRGSPRKKIHLELDPATAAEMRMSIAGGDLRVSRGHPFRAQGTYDHFVTYADVLVQIALLAFGLFVTCPAIRARQKFLLGLACVGMGCALWLTLTRMAMASFLLGVVLIVFLACRWRARLMVICLVLIATVAGGFLLHRGRGLGWINLNDQEGQYRLLMWKDGIRLVRDHPWLGIGMESLKTHWREWHIEAYEKFSLHSHFHTTPLQIAVERGLLTFASWLWFLAAYLAILRRLVRRTAKSDWYLQGLSLGLLGATCGFLLGSLTDYNWGDSEVVMIFWMFVGWGLALDRLVDAETSPQ